MNEAPVARSSNCDSSSAASTIIKVQINGCAFIFTGGVEQDEARSAYAQPCILIKQE